MENNWFPNLFDDIIFRIGSSEVEHITHPGECDTMLKLVTKNSHYKDDGWIIDRGDGTVVSELKEPSAAYSKDEIKSITDQINKEVKLNTGYLKRKNEYNFNGNK